MGNHGFGLGLFFVAPLAWHCILYFACIFREREWVAVWNCESGSRLSLPLSFEVSLNGFLSVAVFGLPETGNSSNAGHHFAYVAQYSIKYSFIFLQGFVLYFFSVDCLLLSLAITLQVIALSISLYFLFIFCLTFFSFWPFNFSKPLLFCCNCWI